MPVLSIIVPVFNKVKYLDNCIKSILAQTFSDFELILVNDGSTDGSELKCDQYKKSDKRIIVIHQENQGVSSARNSGIAAAKGVYIGFIDSDDTVDKEMYKILINNALINFAEISICRLREKREQTIYNTNLPIAVYSRDDAISAFFKGRLDYSACNKIFKATIIEKIVFEGSMFEDAFFTFRAFLVSKKSVSTQYRLYNYFNSNNSVSMSKFSVKYMQIVGFTQRMKNIVSQISPRHVEEASALDVIMNISLLNLVLFAGKNKFKDEYRLIVNHLGQYSAFVKVTKVLNRKHRIAYNLFKFSPVVYPLVLKAYCLIFSSHVGRRS